MKHRSEPARTDSIRNYFRDLYRQTSNPAGRELNHDKVSRQCTRWPVMMTVSRDRTAKETHHTAHMTTIILTLASYLGHPSSSRLSVSITFGYRPVDSVPFILKSRCIMFLDEGNFKILIFLHETSLSKVVAPEWWCAADQTRFAMLLSNQYRATSALCFNKIDSIITYLEGKTKRKETKLVEF